MKDIKGFTAESWRHKFLPMEDAYKYSQKGKLEQKGVCAILLNYGS